jgi:hypothetical protein
LPPPLPTPPPVAGQPGPSGEDPDPTAALGVDFANLSVGGSRIVFSLGNLNKLSFLNEFVLAKRVLLWGLALCGRSLGILPPPAALPSPILTLPEAVLRALAGLSSPGWWLLPGGTVLCLGPPLDSAPSPLVSPGDLVQLGPDPLIYRTIRVNHSHYYLEATRRNLPTVSVRVHGRGKIHVSPRTVVASLLAPLLRDFLRRRGLSNPPRPPSPPADYGRGAL